MKKFSTISILVLLSLWFVACKGPSGKTSEQTSLVDTTLLDIIEDPALPYEDGKPVVFLLHGWGSNPQDLLGLGKSLNRKYNYLAVEAPYKIGPESYSWFGIQFVEGEVNQLDYDEFSVSLEKLLQLIESFKYEKQLKNKDIILMGFSQGATMALEMAIHHPNVFSGAIVLSGLLANDPSTYSNLSTSICDVDVFQAHGKQDPVVPIETARQVKDIFKDCDSYIFEKYDMGHQVTLPLINDINKWLELRLKLNTE